MYYINNWLNVETQLGISIDNCPPTFDLAILMVDYCLAGTNISTYDSKV